MSKMRPDLEVGWPPPENRSEATQLAKLIKVREATIDREETGIPQSTGAPMPELDVDQVFMLFASFCGNIERTAYAAGITKAEVCALSSKHDWAGQLKGLLELRGTERSGDVERGISQALNFIQAHRFRLLLERVLRKLVATPDEDILKLLVTEQFDKQGASKGKAISTRAFADLASAMEKVHWMTYQALNDTVPERAKRKLLEDDLAVAECDIHARIAKTLSDMRKDTPKSHLLEAQAEQAAFLVGPPAATPKT